MGFFSKFFNLGQRQHQLEASIPDMLGIRFGRYSDNNKSLQKTRKWFEADELYKQKKYIESIETFFDYILDDPQKNVSLEKNETGYTFSIYQGSCIIHGNITSTDMSAWVYLAQMDTNSVPVMRQLLEMNNTLYYARFAIHDQKLCMLFDTPLDTSNPNKLYYGLKELATQADKNDDVLLSDFRTLKPLDTSHIFHDSEKTKHVKYQYFNYWISNTLKQVEEVNADTFSGGIAYLLLTLIYRIDFLIVPEGKLLNEIEKINQLYWLNKETKNAVERNELVKDAFEKLLTWPEEEVLKCFYSAKSTFSIALPTNYAEITENIQTSKNNMVWYIENKYEPIALTILEYSLAYAQFSYSLPKPVLNLFMLYMQINHASYFEELGIVQHYISQGKLKEKSINQSIEFYIQEFKDKYPYLSFNSNNLDFSTLLNFNTSFLTEMQSLNFDNK